MQQNWNIKSRSHECSRSGRPFEEGEVFHTSIYFDTESGEFVRRDVALDVWEEELKERTPLAYWRTTYVKPDSGKPKVEMSSKESPETLLRRLIDEDEEHTENARYILALMLERKKQFIPKESKYTEQGTLLLYEHRKSGEVFIIRDPELRLDEVASMQEEVATLLGFGGPVVEAAKVAGVTLTADGKIEKKEDLAPGEPDKESSEPVQVASETSQSETTESETPESEATDAEVSEPDASDIASPETEAAETESTGSELVESEDTKTEPEETEDAEAAGEESVKVEGEPIEPEDEGEASPEDEAESKKDDSLN